MVELRAFGVDMDGGQAARIELVHDPLYHPANTYVPRTPTLNLSSGEVDASVLGRIVRSTKL